MALHLLIPTHGPLPPELSLGALLYWAWPPVVTVAAVLVGLLWALATRTVARDRATESLSWLPADALAAVVSGIAVSLTPSGAVQVTVTYNGYNVSPPLPVLDLPIIGKVPDLPDKLVGQAVAQPG
mgnify:CR=1 FL=1